ncbi:MAG: hypothetical protein HY763_16760, partial [Planctomycetes bacterium]|nr:hypothetical protein [Planctomycetota bacterium]
MQTFPRSLTRDSGFHGSRRFCGLAALGVFCVLAGGGAQCIIYIRPPFACDEDADCDDGWFCNGAEDCVGGRCRFSDWPCEFDETCNEEFDRCDECEEDEECEDDVPCTADSCEEGRCRNLAQHADCDDDDACTDDLCNPSDAQADENGCVHSAVECPAGTVCDGGECSPAPCTAAAGCDDNDPCTHNVCARGLCAFTTVDCDDGLFCTGVESCDPITGECVSGGDPCGASGALAVCDEATDSCADSGIVCTVDADCDDGAFCNGIETCDVETGDCEAGPRPCLDINAVTGAPGSCAEPGILEACAEGDTGAICTPCPTAEFDCTLSLDTVTGTSGEDVFLCDLLFSTGTGQQIASLQTGDRLSGLAGNDRLDATVNAPGGTVQPFLSGIETVRITCLGDSATNANGCGFNASNVSGAEQFASVQSTDDLAITNIQESAGFAVVNVNDADVDFSLAFADADITAGANDTITGSFEGAVFGNVTIASAPGAASGFEALSISSRGTSANRAVGVIQANAGAMATAAFTGAQNLTLNTLPNSVRTVNGSAMTGGLTLGAGTTAGAYVQFNTANLLSVSGGSGNDTIILNNTLDSNDFTAGTLDLGTGTDVVQATFAADF